MVEKESKRLQNLKKKSIVYYPDRKVYEYQGKKFKESTQRMKVIDGIEHVECEFLEEINEEEYNKHIETIKKEILDKLPKERIAEEILKGYSVSAIKKMAKQITDKKAKAKRQDGCLGIKLDGGKYNSSYIQIFD